MESKELLTRGITLFYSKRTGEIVSYVACSAKQTFNDYFGSSAEDMKLIYDCIFTDYDEDIFNNMKNYKVENDQVVKKENEIDLLKKEIKNIKQTLKVNFNLNF